MERINKIVNESIVKYDEQLHTLFEDLTKDLLLLANGVILPPCKVGSVVFQTDGVRIYPLIVERVIYDTNGIAFDERAIGKTIFLTREEAERALKGGAK